MSAWSDRVSDHTSSDSWAGRFPGLEGCVCNVRLAGDPDSPCSLLLQLGAEQQVGEEEDVTEFPGTFYQLHHEAVPQKLAVLPTGNHITTLQTFYFRSITNLTNVLTSAYKYQVTYKYIRFLVICVFMGWIFISQLWVRSKAGHDEAC